MFLPSRAFMGSCFIRVVDLADSKFSLLFLLFLWVLLLSGCSSPRPDWPSDGQRADSFLMSQHLLVGEEPISLYLQRRTAVIVSGLPVVAVRLKGSEASIEFVEEPETAMHCGEAIAIDVSGYFITAAHCVKDPVNYLIYSTGESARIGVPRVVATIKDPETHLDIALLHLGVKLSHVFNWANLDSDWQGRRVVGVGASQIMRIHGNRGFLQTQCFGGAIASIQPAPYGSRMIQSDLPARSGDSGGPIVGEDGKLLGVHTGIGTGAVGIKGAFAFRPDLKWLIDEIEKDKIASIPVIQPEFQELEGGGDAPGIVISLR
ncbi:MAG: peptidase and chymotrypsin/Hap [Verrucomicrobiales bacterium]|nr:peptidase and chymotrypsin/Hap [Verrucomicrobiales bacterium]